MEIKKFAGEYLDNLKKNIDELDLSRIEAIINVIYDAYKKNKQIFILGNGGSASTASHFACDLGKGTLSKVYDSKEKRFKVMSLTDNIATITAYANDVSYDEIFSQQLKNLISEGDVVIAISGSGNSENVLKAVKIASEAKAVTIGFMGFDGGKLKNLVKCPIIVSSKHYGRIEDIHMVLEHLICSCLSEMKKRD